MYVNVLIFVLLPNYMHDDIYMISIMTLTNFLFRSSLTFKQDQKMNTTLV